MRRRRRGRRRSDGDQPERDGHEPGKGLLRGNLYRNRSGQRRGRADGRRKRVWPEVLYHRRTYRLDTVSRGSRRRKQRDCDTHEEEEVLDHLQTSLAMN